MKNNWKKVIICNYCEITSSKRIFAREYVEKGIPFYRGKEISEKQKNSDSNGLLYISEERYEEIKNRFGVPRKGDILLTSVGTLGNPYFVKSDSKFYFKDGNLTWFKNFKNIKSKWLYYWILSPQGKAELKKCIIGSSQSAYTINLLSGMKIPLPPKNVQQKIASVLSAYDNLIEVNNRRIKILEEMAQRIYNEWFVEFKFPGYEKVKIKNGVPEGWGKKNILDIDYFNFCKSKIKEYEGEKEYFATANIDGINIVKDGELVAFNEKPSRAQIQPKVNSIWFARMKDSYKVLSYRKINKDLADKHILSSGMIGFEAEEEYFGFLYFTIKSDWFHDLKDQYATGATQVSLTNAGLAGIKILVPDKKIASAYSKKVNIFIDKMLNLQRINNNLCETRDLLLPKLMSGEIKIS